MARIVKIFILSMTLLAACFHFLFYSTRGRVESVDSEAILFGPAQVYAASCAKCHGADGRARTAKGKRVGATDFTSSDWNADEARAIRIITNGKSEMPAFKGKLSANEIKSVFEYVLRFRR